MTYANSLLLVSCSWIAIVSGLTGCERIGTEAAGGSGGWGTTAATSHLPPSTSTGIADIGEPSDVYPAPHSPAPTAINLGGPTITSAKFYPLVFAQDDHATVAKISDFMSKVEGSNYWSETTSEYGIGASQSEPPITLNEFVGGTIDDSEIQTWLAAKLNGGDPKFPVIDDSTVFAIFYPATVSVTLSGSSQLEKSCADFGGYHSNLTLDAAHGSRKVPYAVIPRCPTFFKTFTGIDAITAPASHELIEVVTDPFANSAPAFEEPDQQSMVWAFAVGGGEVGDLCAQNQGVFTKVPGFDYVVQRTWSNNSASQGHDPCVPAPTGKAYFNAAPVFPDVIALSGYSISGVRIPVGQSRSVDVQLFSDAPTGPIHVTAMDTSEEQGGPKMLGFHFDADTGLNGQTLHMTVDVLNATVYNAEVFYVDSTSGDQHNRWIGLVGN